jgi:hypothetical protein
MINSKSIELLKTFSKKELKNFNDFLNSPFHNSNNRIIQLYKALKKFYPEFKDEKLSYEYLFNTLFRKNKYNEALVRNVLSDLLEAEENFMAHKALQNSQYEKFRIVNKELIDRNLYSHFKMKFKLALKELEKSELKNEYYLQYRYLFLFQNMMVARTTEHEYDDLSKQLSETENALAEYTAAQLGSFYIPFATHEYVPMEKLKPVLYEPTLNILSLLKNTGSAAVRVFYSMHQLAKTGKDEYYFLATENLMKYEKIFEFEEVKNFHILLHNYALNKVNSGNADFRNEYNNIIDIFIKKNFFRNQNEYISQPFFRNAVLIKVRLNKIAEAREFVEKFHTGLPAESRENNYFFSLGYIAFNERKYNESLSVLARIVYDEYLLKLQTECLILQNYYELELGEETIYKIDSLSHYISAHKKIPSAYAEFYSNFIMLLRKILRLRQGPAPEDTFELKNEITNLPAAAKSWLLEKIIELEK